jgi:hypothetical protein
VFSQKERIKKMQYPAPKCYGCKFLRKLPEFIGENAKCKKYPNGVPRKVFFMANPCSFFSARNKDEPDNPA